MSHPLKHRRPGLPAWPTYTGASELVGKSPSGRGAVYVDPSLGPRGMQNAISLIGDADRVVAANDKSFGTVGGNVSVIIFALGGATDGTGGADHAACDYANGGAIEVCAAFGNPAMVSAPFEAELSECSMGHDLWGLSTGEALSRWCANTIGGPHVLDAFASAPAWAADGMPDFVTITDKTDQNYDSIGCGMAFLSLLVSNGHGLETIAPAMVSLGNAGTLAQLYGQLTSASETLAWPAFQTAVTNLGGAAAIKSDDPFAAAGHAPGPTLALAGQLTTTILTDLAAGDTASKLAADILAIAGTA